MQNSYLAKEFGGEQGLCQQAKPKFVTFLINRTFLQETVKQISQKVEKKVWAIN